MRKLTRRELAALRGYLELSLLTEGVENPSRGEAISDAAARIRRERNAHRAAALVDDAVSSSRERPAPRAPTGERHRTDEFSGSDGWAWIRPARRLDTYRERVVAASEEHSEHSAAQRLGRDQVENAEGSPGRV